MTAFEIGRTLAAGIAPGGSVGVSCDEDCETPERAREVMSGILDAGAIAHYLAAVPRCSLRHAIRSLPTQVHVHIGRHSLKLFWR